jgi:hypothetical protein
MTLPSTSRVAAKHLFSIFSVTPLRGCLSIVALYPMADAMGYRSFAAPRLADSDLLEIDRSGHLAS